MDTYKLVSDLSFERLGGSKDEEKAVEIIKGYITKLGGTPIVEEFNIPYSFVKEVSLKVGNIIYQATGFKRSGNIDETLDLVILDDVDTIGYVNVSGKACLLIGQFNYKAYEELLKQGVKAIIDISGTVYDDILTTDLEEKTLRERHLAFGQVPCFTIRAIDAEQIVENAKEDTKVTLKLVQEEVSLVSRNIITEIKGEIDDEIVCFTAHYDSVRFSKGAYDNATGSATILEMYKYFLENKPLRTLRFIWCGSEEQGLLGSKDYVEKHSEDKIRLCINVDMTAVNLGKDICCVTGEEKICGYIDLLSKEVGFQISVKDGVYSSDSTPFADKGIPALSFARISNRGGARIHSNKDNGKFLSAKYFYKTCDFIKTFASHMIFAKVFPIAKVMPEKMKQEIDKYYGRNQKDTKK